MKCNYCGAQAELKTGAEIYPHRPDLAQKKIWICHPCDARVTCHAGTEKPMGSLANQQLRMARREAHEAFDKVWKQGLVTRTVAYQMLAKQMRMSTKRCHIGQFSVKQCRHVLYVVRSWGIK